MIMREQQWDRSNCRHFRIDVCLHQRIYMRAFVNARNNSSDTTNGNGSVSRKVHSKSYITKLGYAIYTDFFQMFIRKNLIFLTFCCKH